MASSAAILETPPLFGSTASDGIGGFDLVFQHESTGGVINYHFV